MIDDNYASAKEEKERRIEEARRTQDALRRVSYGLIGVFGVLSAVIGDFADLLERDHIEPAGRSVAIERSVNDLGGDQTPPDLNAGDACEDVVHNDAVQDGAPALRLLSTAVRSSVSATYTYGAVFYQSLEPTVFAESGYIYDCVYVAPLSAASIESKSRERSAIILELAAR